MARRQSPPLLCPPEFPGSQSSPLGFVSEPLPRPELHFGLHGFGGYFLVSTSLQGIVVVVVLVVVVGFFVVVVVAVVVVVGFLVVVDVDVVVLLSSPPVPLPFAVRTAVCVTLERAGPTWTKSANAATPASMKFARRQRDAA